MKIIYVVLCICLVSTNCIAKDTDNNNFYFKVNGGPSLPSKVGGDFPGASITNSMAYAVAVGYDFNKHFSADLSFERRGKYKNNYFYTDSDNEEIVSNTYITKIKSTSIMANLYYNFDSYYNFTPYITIGGGVAKNKTDNTIIYTNSDDFVSVGSLSKSEKNNFIYKVGLGTKYRIKSNIEIGIQYQFIDLGKFRTGNTITINQISNTSNQNTEYGRLKSNELLLTATYKFNMGI